MLELIAHLLLLKDFVMSFLDIFFDRGIILEKLLRIQAKICHIFHQFDQNQMALKNFNLLLEYLDLSERLW